MTIPLWGILFLILITFSLAALGVYLRFRELGDFDNNYPRDQTAKLTAPGVTGFAGGRPKSQEIVAYWPALIERNLIRTSVSVEEV